MGCDKALLPHNEGGSWLERSLHLLGLLETPITLLSRHQQHLALAQHLAQELPITALAEPAPWEGPLLALHRLMQQHPNERLLLCPVDMPKLNLAALQTLVAKPNHSIIQLAHDGERLQPLLGLYPSAPAIRSQLTAAIGEGERRLQRWLATQCYEVVPLDPQTICNVNQPYAP